MFKSKNGYIFSIMSAVAMSLTACNGGSDAATGKVLGSDSVVGTPAYVPPTGDETPSVQETPTPDPTVTPDPTPTPTTTPSTVVGETCHSDDPNKICLALKYVVYVGSNNKPVVTQDEAIQNTKEMNNVWKACNIAFQIDEYAAVVPSEFDLIFNTANYGELDEIRRAFRDDEKLLLTTTGSWNRGGSLGNTGANAWANMPGTTPDGVVLEAPVGTYANIIAHELGHYLNLDHVNDNSDLMSPIIYETSTKLTTSQCNEARSAAKYYWKKMIR
jgi:hypothetical protein